MSHLIQDANGNPVESPSGHLPIQMEDGSVPCTRTVDVIYVSRSGVFTHLRRVQLTSFCATVVWEQDFSEYFTNLVAAETTEPLATIFSPSKTGGCLAFVRSVPNPSGPEPGIGAFLFEVSIEDGSYSVVASSATNTDLGGLGVNAAPWGMTQESLQVFGIETFYWSSEDGSTIATLCGALGDPIVATALVGDMHVAVTRTAAGPTYFPTLIRVNEGACTAVDEVTLDEGYFTSWMLFDEQRNAFYMFATNGSFVKLWSIDYPSYDVTLVDTSEGNSVYAVTLHSDGLWWIQGRCVFHWDIVNGTITEEMRVCESVSEFGSAAYYTMPGIPVGDGFIVGDGYSCKTDCECEPSVVFTPATVEIDEATCQVTPEIPGVDQDINCLFAYDYEITLCPGRTLRGIYIGGNVGDFGIVSVGSVYGIEDWSEIPLTGQIYFRVDGEPGVLNATVRVTVVDSEGCCVTEELDVECCKCEAPDSNVNQFTDVEANEVGPLLDQSCGPSGLSYCHQYNKYTLNFPVGGTSTDCPGYDNDIFFLVEWNGTVDWSFNPINQVCYPAGADQQFIVDQGYAGAGACIYVTPVSKAGCSGERFQIDIVSAGDVVSACD